MKSVVGLCVAWVVGFGAVCGWAAPVTRSLGPLATASSETGGAPALNDQSWASQYDTGTGPTSWCAVVWASAQDLSRIINTQKTVYYPLSPSVSTDGIRLVITRADNDDGYARIGEVMLFGIIPPAGSAMLLR